MTAIKNCIKGFELLDSEMQSIYQKKINSINKTVLPKTLLRANTQKIETEEK
jgi:hypothetical protein